MTAYYNEIDPYAAQWLRNLIDEGHIAKGEVDERSIVDIRPSELRGFKQCHFFAGIGGWSLAARLAGWPDDRPLWTGSCPCQPFSVAGKGAGHKDDRHLWPIFQNIIREGRPEVVFGEQVASAEVVGSGDEIAFTLAVREGRIADANRLAKKLCRSKSFHFHARWIDGVLSDLETLGYSGWSDVVPACAVDAPHRRDRLWFVADAAAQGEGRRRVCRPGEGARASDEWASGEFAGPREGALGNTVISGLEGQPRHGEDRDQPRRIEAQPDGSTAKAGVSAWAGAEWLCGADGKARRFEPGIRLLAHGVPARVGKLRAYGNAIVPQVGAEIIAAYMEISECP